MTSNPTPGLTPGGSVTGPIDEPAPTLAHRLTSTPGVELDGVFVPFDTLLALQTETLKLDNAVGAVLRKHDLAYRMLSRRYSGTTALPALIASLAEQIRDEQDAGITHDPADARAHINLIRSRNVAATGARAGGGVHADAYDGDQDQAELDALRDLRNAAMDLADWAENAGAR